MVVGTPRGAYSPEEKTLLHAVSEVVGKSLTNAKLYSLTRRALDATRKTQGYLESFVLSTRMGVLVLDEVGVAMIVNQEAEDFLGTPSEAILRRNALEALGNMGERGEALLRGFEACFREKRGFQYTQAMGDQIPPMLVNVFPLFREGSELIGAAATFTRA